MAKNVRLKQISSAGACVKIHSCHLHAPLCGIFALGSLIVVFYSALSGDKSPENYGAHLTESNFQIRSATCTIIG